MKTTGIGGIVLFLTAILSVILCHVCATTILCKSKTIAFVLHTLLHMPYHEHDKKIIWQGRSELTAQITVCTVFAVFMMIYGLQYPDILNWAECLSLMVTTVVSFGRMMFGLAFFRVSSKFVSEKLYSFTSDEVSKSSSALLGVQQLTLKELKSQNQPHALSTMTEETLSDSWDVVVQKAMQPLFELQIKVCQIEVIREQLTSNCFELVSFSLLSSVVSLVTCIFAIISQNWLSGGAPILVLSSFSLLTYVCYVGHSFTRKVKEAVGILKTLSCRSKNQSIKAQTQLSSNRSPKSCKP
ncbi:hypothetical protein SK128_010102 [Halocaridina rubra]|uniref:Uncharacterized protein n=1 Tax=Halocaridina rubra TaxID=373956 RepID=A0AAN8ZXH4_HALRR